METTSQATITEFLGKIPNRKKKSNEQCNFCEAKISLDEIINSCPFRYLLLLGKAWHHGVTFRIGIMSVIYEKGDKKDISNYRLISLLNLNYKIYTTILKSRMPKTADTIINLLRHLTRN